MPPNSDAHVVPFPNPLTEEQRKTKATRDFYWKEYLCPCGCGKASMQQVFIDFMQRVRDRAGVAISLASAYRCVKHNREIGGAVGSDHLDGMAVDPVVRSKRDIMLLLRAAFLECPPDMQLAVGIGLRNPQLHIGLRPETALWSYDA